MTQPLRRWKVLPHGPLARVEPNILTLVGQIDVPLGKFPRRMTIVRLRRGGGIVYNGIALEPMLMRELERFALPAFLVVPNDQHRLDARIWKERYPGIQVVCAPGARTQVEKIVAVDTTTPAFDDPQVEFVVVPGTGDHECALTVRSRDGTTLVVNDIIGNIRDAHGLSGWLLRRMGFAGDRPQVPAIARLAWVKDKPALARQLARWSAIEPLRRILPSHGSPIEGDVNATLMRLADSLA
jgi:hypothetical protein